MTERSTEWRVLASPLDVAREAAVRFVEAAERAVRAHGTFAVALSGGSTPMPLFELLASQEWRKRVSWRDVHIFWTDERCVPPHHEDSNFGLVERTLLRHVPVPGEQVHRIRGEADPGVAADEYERELRTFANSGPRPVLDLVFLGLGADGHTASLFPDSEAFRHELTGGSGRWVVSNSVPQLAGTRVTMTTAPINAAAEVVFLVTGGSKAEALKRVTRDAPAGEPLPAHLIRPDGRLMWLIDEAAAGGLKSFPTRDGSS
jgi:6-phosphogluconolactonase